MKPDKPSPLPDAPSTRPTLGRVLSGLRARNGWTLKEMSQHTGIPLSTLAKIEHDRLSLTYDKLQQLSERLKMRMSDLFAEPAGDSEAVTARRSIGDLDRAIRIKTHDYDYYFLCSELRRKRMIPLLTHIRARNVEDLGALVRHAGEEYVYVLEGRIEVHTEFYDPVVLEPGQSMYIDSNMGHAYVAAPGCKEARVLTICSSTDENLADTLMELHDPLTSVTPCSSDVGHHAPDVSPARNPARRSTAARARKKT